MSPYQSETLSPKSQTLSNMQGMSPYQPETLSPKSQTLSNMQGMSPYQPETLNPKSPGGMPDYDCTASNHKP